MSLLSTPLDTVLSSASKVRVLRLLIEQDRIVSGREAARLTGMSHTAIRRAIDDLARSGLIHRENSGRQLLCRANRDNLLVLKLLVPLFAAEAHWPKMLFSRIREMVSRIEHQVPRSAHDQIEIIAVWIFGSIAKGTDQPGSDFDIMFLVRNEYTADSVGSGIVDLLHDLSRELGTDVRPVVLTLAQAKHQLSQHDYFIMGALRSARVVVGEIPAELRIGKANDRQARR